MADCPYTGLALLAAGDGVSMCESCICWGWSETDELPK